MKTVVNLDIIELIEACKEAREVEVPFVEERPQVCNSPFDFHLLCRVQLDVDEVV